MAKQGRGAGAWALAMALGLTIGTGCYGGAKVAFPEGAPGAVTVPMLLDPADPTTPIVEVSVSGVDAPLFFAIAVEEPTSDINTFVATAGRFPITIAQGFHGTGMWVRAATIPEVSIGGFRLVGHDWAVDKDDEPGWNEISGTIGADALRNVDLVIDHRAGTVSFYPKGTAPARGTAVPMKRRGPGLPLVDVALPGGRTVHLTLATTFPATHIVAEASGLKGKATRVRASTTTRSVNGWGVDSRAYWTEVREGLRIAGAKVGTVELRPFDIVLEKDPYKGIFDVQDGLLGASSLLNFVQTISPSRNTLWLDAWSGPFARRTSYRERLVSAARERMKTAPTDALSNWLLGVDLPWMLNEAEAEKSLAMLAERFPNEGAYGRRWASIASWRGDFTEAEKRAAATVVDSGDKGLATLTHAATLFDLGKLDEAIARADEVIAEKGGPGGWAKLWISGPRKKSSLESAYYFKAYAQYLKGDLDGATASARDSIDTVGEYLPARSLTGRIYLARGEIAYAGDQFEFLLDKVGVNPAEVIDAYAEFGRLADLEPLLTKLRDQTAKIGWAGTYDRALGWLYRELGQPARAVEAFERVVGAAAGSLSEQIEIVSTLAFDLGRFDEALAKLEAAKSEYPGRDVRFEEVRADILIGASRFEEGLAAAKAALALWPTGKDARDLELTALWYLRRPDERLVVLRELAELYDSNRAAWVITLRALGREEEAKPIAAIMIALDKVSVSHAPRSASVRAHLAEDMALSGVDLDEARKHAEEAESMRPGMLLPKLALGEVLLAKGDKAGALAAAGRALAIVPWNPWGLDIAKRAKK